MTNIVRFDVTTVFTALVFQEEGVSDSGLTTEWKLFATSHGKSLCDGIGGTVKCLVGNVDYDFEESYLTWLTVLGTEKGTVIIDECQHLPVPMTSNGFWESF